MQEAHLEALAELEALCFSQPWSFSALRDELTNPNACFLVAAENGSVLGYAGMHFVVPEFYMDNLAVFPAHRRRGVAQKLILALSDFALSHHGTTLSLEVRPSNTAALALYSRLGFTQVGRRPGFYSRPVEDALLLQLVLRRD